MGLQELRKQRGLTQRELSARTGIAQPNIAKYESGISDIGNMTLRNAIKLADTLRVTDVRKLLNGNAKP